MAAVPSIGRAVRVEGAPAPEADLTRALYEQYGSQLFRYCLHQLGSREEAEDAVQSTFLNAFRGIKRGVVPELESAWLFKIAHNVCLSRRRTSWRRGRIESPTDFDVVEELTPAPSRRADELMGLQDVLEQMPENQRRAILLREWQGLSYREIGEELELSQAAVETLIFRARRSLAAGLEQPPEAKRRLARGTDLGNILAGVKSLFVGGGAAVKVAATVAVVSASTVVAAAPVQQSHARSHQPVAPVAPAPAHTASAPAAGAVAGPAASFPRRVVKAGAKSSTPSRLELFARLGAASTTGSTPDPSTFAAPPAPAAAEPASVSVTPTAAEAPPAQPAAPVEPQHAPAASVPAVAPASMPASAAKGGDSKTNDSAKVSVPATLAPTVATTPVLPSQGTQGSQGSAERGGEQNGNGSGDSKGSDTKKTGAPIVTLPSVTLAVQPQTTTTAPVVSLTTTTTTAPAVIVTQQAGNSKSDDKKSISTPPTPAAPVLAPAATVTLPIATLTTVANTIGVAVLASVQAAAGKTTDRRDKGGDNNTGNDNH